MSHRSDYLDSLVVSISVYGKPLVCRAVEKGDCNALAMGGTSLHAGSGQYLIAMRYPVVAS